MFNYVKYNGINIILFLRIFKKVVDKKLNREKLK